MVNIETVDIDHDNNISKKKASACSFTMKNGDNNKSRPRSPSSQIDVDNVEVHKKRLKLNNCEANDSCGNTQDVVDKVSNPEHVSDDVILLTPKGFKQRPYSSEIKIVKLEEKRWMCDVCKVAQFSNFVEACMHEIACKMSDRGRISCNRTSKDFITPRKGYQIAASIADPMISTKQVNMKNSEKIFSSNRKKMKETALDISLIPEMALDISLIPDDHNILSEYNYILTRNIEFFEISPAFKVSKDAIGSDVGSITKSKVGLRCIHCATKVRHTNSAASFFPSTIGSIASGLGTIGARHFAGGKCSFINEKRLEELRLAKKTSQQQTRIQGKIGLDAYCRELAKTKNISNNAFGGIYVDPTVSRKDETSIIKVLDNQVILSNKAREQTDILKDASSYIEGAVEHFWECKHCNMLPFPWRASGSVVFCATAPTMELVRKHLAVCQGKKPLRIPRNATIETNIEKNGTSVHVRWEKFSNNVRKSSRIQRRNSNIAESTLKQPSCTEATLIVEEGIEEKPLAFPDDKSQTTEFAYYTMMQLKKCYLTKAGGSRSNCPLGYPGLACLHCAGTGTQRRFFYTSSDHLRNSFSHIPAHLGKCKKCPEEVKTKIEALKELRNAHKANLRIGDHKMFIDRVWERLHGPGGGIINLPQNDQKRQFDSNNDRSDNGGSVSSVSIESHCDQHDYQNESSDGRWLENSDIAIEQSNSELVFQKDRKLTTDYVYYSMLQMSPQVYDELKQKKDTDEKTSMCEFPTDVNKSAISNSNNSLKLCEVAPTRPHYVEVKTENKSNETSEIQRGGSNSQKARKTLRLVCKHCVLHDNFVLFPQSVDELRSSFSKIAKHLMMCSKCPTIVKDKLKTFKTLRATQEALLRRGMHKKFMNLVWNRFNQFDQKSNFLSPKKGVIRRAGLLSEEDRKLVTAFTYYTMQQMKPCSLENSGNGSRSMFQCGFPGLVCVHCERTPSARKFFYRTADILSGNYAHIPNHLMSCKCCPIHVKASLAQKKKSHADDKLKLSRGSQRIFFNNLWGRLHQRH